MTSLDYYENPRIRSAISIHESHIHNREDREDCRQEIFAELYDFMPLDEDEAIRLVDKVAMRFRRGAIKISENEVPLTGNE